MDKDNSLAKRLLNHLNDPSVSINDILLAYRLGLEDGASRQKSGAPVTIAADKFDIFPKNAIVAESISTGFSILYRKESLSKERVCGCVICVPKLSDQKSFYITYIRAGNSVYNQSDEGYINSIQKCLNTVLDDNWRGLSILQSNL